MQKYNRAILALFVFAAVVYNAWPLGYILNPNTASGSLVSDLDGSGQPYRWLFIGGDFLVGLSLTAVCILIWLKLKHILGPNSLMVLLIGLVMFALFTATSAVASSDCTTASIQICARFDKRLFGPDGIESALAALGLFISLIGANVLLIRRKKKHWALTSSALGILIGWPISLVAFLVAASANDNAHLTQLIELVVSGVVLVIIGLCINAKIKDADES